MDAAHGPGPDSIQPQELLIGAEVRILVGARVEVGPRISSYAPQSWLGAQLESGFGHMIRARVRPRV